MLKTDNLFRIGKFFLIGSVTLILGFLVWKKVYSTNDLTLYGNVDIRQTDLSFQVGGKIEKMLVEEGDEVKPGTVLAVLSQAPYEARVAEAKAALEQAEAHYTKHAEGNRPQEIEQAKATVEERKSILEHSHNLWKRQKKHLEIQTTSQESYEGAHAAKEQAEALLKQAEHTLSLLEEGFRKEDVAAAKAGVERAKADLTLAEIYLKDASLIAPAAGIILVRVGEIGEVVSPQSVVYTLSLRKPVYVRAYVREEDLGYLKPGMKVQVFSDTYPTQPLVGKIGFISPQAEFTPKTVETPAARTDLVYRIRVVVEDPKGKLRQGMPVTLKIKTLH